MTFPRGLWEGKAPRAACLGWRVWGEGRGNSKERKAQRLPAKRSIWEAGCGELRRKVWGQLLSVWKIRRQHQ